MELDGLDALLAKLEQMEDGIDDDVNTIVKNNTIEMTGETKMNERDRFDKGYWTGHTIRNTKTQKLGALHYRTFADSEYAGYLNFGTRYMDPTWFLRDAFYKQREKFKEDLDRLVK
ncbi:phage protein, HK97 gp10 family [Halobacillus karajensis]|uniref:Phage protein, HK97 gp10 family n=1 Tax=Halobacillus karajensis TaxID=195088 RepID=A0A024P3U4_9BACI|nr:HK97-gp10 family putative phage morphogenesis protein [Halobacillus karajensis]CDQ20856.1 phage protein, HK97 gp10 family [Halobacillus karajensis]CDQ23674.1 phage protein, HK97 gp10 family [Halobacillus karajensis]CDQ27152.1 phage protein, HK97 gp10 family [Halobacillus karajensis]SEI03642.1 phage protein, HK97 gp10 family [Halobacillus karajensis]